MSAETVRNHYRKQGAEQEQERIIALLIEDLELDYEVGLAHKESAGGFGIGATVESLVALIKEEVSEVVHQCPPDGSDIMLCCGRTPYEVPQTDRIALRRYESLETTPPNCQGEEQ